MSWPSMELVERPTGGVVAQMLIGLQNKRDRGEDGGGDNSGPGGGDDHDDHSGHGGED